MHPDPFTISDELVEEIVQLNPLMSTSLGLPGRDHLWPDFGPDGVDAQRATVERYRTAFAGHLDHADPWQRLAAEVAYAFLGEQKAGYDAGDHLYDVSHMASSFEAIRSVFDVMDSSTPEGREAVCARLETIGGAFEGYRDKLKMALHEGKIAARRQAESVIAQARDLGGPSSAFDCLAGTEDGSGRLAGAVAGAKRAASEFADFLQHEYLPHAPESDGVGEERYRRAAESFVGMAIDPRETYEWGWFELGRILEEMRSVGEEIQPGATVREVADLLETDPDRAAPNRAAFVDFVQRRQTSAVSDLDGPHFDVPDEIKGVSVNIAPPGGPLGAYYLQPSEDFTTRLGGIWYSLPPEDGPIPLYQEVSTAYHEGFPGHHLQVAYVMTLAERLSRFHRLMVWYSGYGEGWALYTERLMHELGYFEKPDYVFGMLASHVFRAARVVVDIGMHLGFRIPSDAPLHPGAQWDFDKAVDYMNVVGLQPRP
ncbi:MAG: DUF885 domain-containing protein, partial [Acidimicrobiia bacterium]|nr:DUF885 domain-containing protein [Acidimicrobiia bacterium]